VKNEWAMTSEDILWRRTKQGLHASTSGTESLDFYLADKITTSSPGPLLHQSV
jgi:glycerol-3-phosphate dehydrogenase